MRALVLEPSQGGSVLAIFLSKDIQGALFWAPMKGVSTAFLPNAQLSFIKGAFYNGEEGMRRGTMALL